MYSHVGPWSLVLPQGREDAEQKAPASLLDSELDAGPRNRQAMNRRSMVSFDEDPRPLEESARAAQGGESGRVRAASLARRLGKVLALGILR